MISKRVRAERDAVNNQRALAELQAKAAQDNGRFVDRLVDRLTDHLTENHFAERIIAQAIEDRR